MLDRGARHTRRQVVMSEPTAIMDDLEMLGCLKAVPVPLVIAKVSGEVIWANAAAGFLLSCQPEDLIGCSLAEACAVSNPDDAEVPVAPGLLTARTNAGDTIFIETQAAESLSDSGTRYLTIVLKDVTERQHAESRLKSELQRLEVALDGAGIGVFEVDLISGRSTVSQTWKRLMGVSGHDQVDGQRLWLDRMHPDDRPIVEAADRECIEGRSPRSLSIYRVRTADGTEWRWMRSDAVVASWDTTGKATRLIGAQSDVTQLKAADDALRLHVEEFRSSFDNAPIGKAIVGLDGRWLRVNSVLCELFGYSEQRLLETDFQTLTHPEDLEKDLDHVRSLIAGEGSTYRMEKRYFRSDGGIILVDLSVAIVRDKAGEPLHFVSQLLDVTEQRNLERMKGQFVANVSHELRTPLTSILGALGLLAAMPGNEFPDEANRLIYIAQQNAERLKMRISDILDFEGLTTGRLKLSLAPERIAPLLEKSLLNSVIYAQKYDVKIVLDAMDRSMTSRVDADRFEQVVANLLSNAAKYAETGSTVRIGMTSSEEMISVHVTNRGPVIPEKYRGLLFKPFSHIEKPAAQKREGTGLGLSICKQIVEQMGGRIGFETEEGSTTFWFTLPQASMPAQPGHDGPTIAGT
ncbi:MAG: hypothetical protein C0524_15610 [Rhodobacter sp.]|nr:hypothetical protein [Rhodobacter sp.]